MEKNVHLLRVSLRIAEMDRKAPFIPSQPGNNQAPVTSHVSKVTNLTIFFFSFSLLNVERFHLEDLELLRHVIGFVDCTDKLCRSSMKIVGLQCAMVNR